MINFEEELKKFHPSLEVGEVQDAIYHQNLTDAVDLLINMLKGPEAPAMPEYPQEAGAYDANGYE